jgi:hypothetical protein
MTLTLDKKAYMKEYREKHKEHLKEIKKKWYQTNKNRIIERVKNRYQSNKPKVLDYAKKYRESKKDIIREYKKEWSKTPKGKIIRRISLKKYRQTPKGKIVYKLMSFKHNSQRRAKFPINLTLKEINFIKQRDGLKCVYCDCEVFENINRYNSNRLTFDHVDCNGSTDVNNIVIACRKCNIEKNDRDVFVFCKEKGFEIPQIIKQLSF